MDARRVRPGSVAFVAAAVLAVLVPVLSSSVLPNATAAAADPAPAADPTPGAGEGPGRSRDSALAELLLTSVRSAGFDRVVDFGPVRGQCPGSAGCPDVAPRIAQTPNLDTAVIELDEAGRVTGAAEVLLSRDHPSGVAVPVDGDLRAGVRWYRWDQSRADGDTAWDAPRTPAADLVPGRASAPLGFMSPYPASLLDLLVAAGTLHLVDTQVLALDRAYTYRQADGSSCLGDTFTATATTGQLLDRMVTRADPHAACMLIKQVHDLGRMSEVNDWLTGLGLDTLQLAGTDPGSGGRWQVGQVTMTALDTARLLLLVGGASGTLWKDSRGSPVTAADALSPGSQQLLYGLLGQQGFNEVLSTANWCGRGYPAKGIPHRVSTRWIDPVTGTVSVGDVPYGQDVTPCNARAQVDFAHLTGLSYGFAGDAGIVHALPGARFRHYVVVVLSDLGYRYGDARNRASPVIPCTVDVCVSQSFARLGAQVDAGIGAPTTPAGRDTPVPRPATPPAAGAGGWRPI